MANILDRVIGYVNPQAGAKRAADRLRMNLLQERSYEAASGGRLAANWYAPSTDANGEIGKASQTLRDRSRDLVRNSTLAAKIVSTHADYFVGYGITPRPKTGDEKKDALLIETWLEFKKTCFTGIGLDFDGGIHLLARMMVTDGGVFVRKRTRRLEDGFPVPLQLQILESEYCDVAKSGTSLTNPLNRIVQGVEYDAIGNRRGYWMFANNPKASHPFLATLNTSSFVPAEDVAHLFEPQSNQAHGVPWITPAMTEIRELRDYELAENLRKKIESCMVGMVTPGDEDTADDPNVGIPETDDPRIIDRQSPAVTDIYGNPFERMEPGMFGVLAGGKNITFNTPAISAGIEGYLRTRHRSIASGVRLPYELMTGDFSQANFASGKLGIKAYERFVQIVQWQILIPQVLDNVWKWFVEAAKIKGIIPLKTVVKVEWSPPEFESITRLDDARADLLEVRMGKRSMPEVISSTGRDPETVLKETDEWNQKVDKTVSKLVFDTDPRKVSINGQMQSESNGDKNAPGSS